MYKKTKSSDILMILFHVISKDMLHHINKSLYNVFKFFILQFYSPSNRRPLWRLKPSPCTSVPSEGY